MAKSKNNPKKVSPKIPSQKVKMKAEETFLASSYSFHSKYRVESASTLVDARPKKTLDESVQPKGLHFLVRDKKFTK